MNTVPPALLLGLSQHTEDGWLDVSTTSASSGEERQQQLSSFKQVQQWATARAPLHVPQVARSSLVYIYMCPVVWFVAACRGWLARCEYRRHKRQQQRRQRAAAVIIQAGTRTSHVVILQ